MLLTSDLLTAFSKPRTLKRQRGLAAPTRNLGQEVKEIARFLTSMCLADLDIAGGLEACTNAQAAKHIGSEQSALKVVKEVILDPARRGPAYARILTLYTKHGVREHTASNQLGNVFSFLDWIATHPTSDVKVIFGGKGGKDLSVLSFQDCRARFGLQLRNECLPQHDGLNSDFNFDAMAASMSRGIMGPYVDFMMQRLSDFFVEYVMEPLAQYEAGEYANRNSQHTTARTVAYGIVLLWFCLVVTPFRAESVAQLNHTLFWDCMQNRTWFVHTNVDKTRRVKVRVCPSLLYIFSSLSK
jgi:hypothetical protein